MESRTVTLARKADSPRPEPLGALVEEHASALCAYVASLGCPGGLIDDVVQDTFLIVLDLVSGPTLDLRTHRRTGAAHQTEAQQTAGNHTPDSSILPPEDD